jgi:hypothetical protein
MDLNGEFQAFKTSFEANAALDTLVAKVVQLKVVVARHPDAGALDARGLSPLLFSPVPCVFGRGWHLR